MQKTAIVTGAYGVIGKAIAEMLAEQGWELILVGRNKIQIEKVCLEISKQTGINKIEPAVVDLSREREIRVFAGSLKQPIDVLINNAGTTPPQRLETSEGIEMQWACNVLGYMWMMEYLQPKIVKGGRIINVASFYAGSLDMADVEFIKRRYDNDTAYRQSKQANRMLSTYFAGLLKPFEITVNSCHPGEISSKLSNNLGFFFPDPPRKGADTPVWMATDHELQNVTGKYFQYRKNIPCQFSNNPTEMKKLYDLCQSYSKS
ncbi:MAG TPA: SDR family NAD(P)-dependent oxidoreductase [Bacteroidales bacterium]|nr:SDR family NAD(P)-dependent oxidoreductase [Bacteroidales bacterium]